MMRCPAAVACIEFEGCYDTSACLCASTATATLSDEGAMPVALLENRISEKFTVLDNA